MTEKKSITGLPLAKLRQEMEALGQPAYRAGQIFTWLHQKQCTSFDEMSNLPAALRQSLQQHYTIDVPQAAQVQRSAQDGTVKLLLRYDDGNCVETVLMRYRHGNTVCVSSQVGCRMGCKFCASAPGGLVRNLTAGEMVAQVDAAAKEAGERIDNVVLMGIGEPLDNFDNVMDFIEIITSEKGRNLSGRGISLSTCGVVPGIEKLAARKLPLTLSISLHATTDEARSRTMPVNKTWPLAVLLDACKQYRSVTKRRVSFEYTMLAGENDSDEDADRLAALLAGSDSHINLIPANEVKESGYHASTRVAAFAKRLEGYGLQVTVRRRLGADIEAACGQLRMNNVRHEG